MLGFLARAAWAQPSDAPARVTDVAVQAVDDTVTVSIATAGAPKLRASPRMAARSDREERI
jgi:hypothetical protein